MLQARIEGYQCLINNENEMMLVLQAREEEPDNPRIVFDGQKGLLFRGGEDVIKFSDWDDNVCNSLQHNEQVLVAETLEGSLSHKQGSNGEIQFGESFEHVYHVPIQYVEALPEHESIEPTEWTWLSWLPDWWFDRIVFTMCWAVVVLALGLVAQSMLPSSKEYPVTAENHYGLKAIAENQIRYSPKSVLRIFGADFYRSSTGAFLVRSYLKTLGTYRWNEVSTKHAQALMLRPNFAWWSQHGWWVVLLLVMVLSFGLSLLPLRYLKWANKLTEKFQS